MLNNMDDERSHIDNDDGVYIPDSNPFLIFFTLL